jgi:hypothetical protein
MASTAMKISIDGHTGHPKDVVKGKAKVCFNAYKGAWVMPGGSIIATQAGAEKVCSELNNILSGVKIS